MEKISIRQAQYAKIGLQDLCDYVKKNSDPKFITVVEIGSYVGDSSEIFAQNFTQVFCVDPWVNGYDENDAASYQHLMSVVEAQFDAMKANYHNIIKMKMTSEEMIKHIQDNSIQLVYIDGLHTYDGVKKDIELWLPKVKKGFFIAGHDYKNKHHPGVAPAVEELLGVPDKIFKDTSWIKQV